MKQEKYEVIIPERIFVVNSLAEASDIFKKYRVNGITIRRIKDIEENLAKQNPQHVLFYICPKCKGRCIERIIGKSKVYDCQNCKDQISSEAIIVAD